MKKYLKFIVPGLLIIIILSWLFWPSKKTAAPTATTKKMEEINKIAVKDRPFVTLAPREDGKEVTLTIDRVKNATKVEYEMEYQAESLIQGVFGTIDLEKDNLPVVKKGLFGTCSKNVCRYDEGVSGGSLVLRLEGGKIAVLKTEFNLQQMFDREGVFTSKDAKATLDVGKTGLPNGTYLIISGTMGLPSTITGTVIAGPYAFLTSGNPVLKNATITIQSKDDLTGAKLMFWNGKTLTELKSTVADGKISAPATGLGIFVVVK